MNFVEFIFLLDTMKQIQQGIFIIINLIFMMLLQKIIMCTVILWKIVWLLSMLEN